MKIAYIFTGGRGTRLKEIDMGRSKPREFFFGLTELRLYGHHVDMFELNDFFPDTPSRKFQILEKVNNYNNSITAVSSCSHLLSPDKIKKLNSYDLIIAGNEYIAFGLNYHRKQRNFDTPVIFFVMGMLSKVQMIREKNESSIRFLLYQYYAKKLYRDLLDGSVKAIFLGVGEQKLAFALFPEYSHKFEYLPFAVDTEFWIPSPTLDEQAANIFFMGNDQQRNFKLLLDIARSTPDINYLFLSTGFDNTQLPENVILKRSDWKKEVFSDEEIREMIQKSIAVILPLHETYQPSGQSVCQQSMSCGKCVLISQTKGFWSPEILKNREHLILVEYQEPAEWIHQINNVISNNGIRKKIGITGRNIMISDFSVECQGKKLNDIIINL